MRADLRATVADRLHRVDQRLTPSRETVVGILDAAGRPLSIPEILRSRSGLAQSSLYRNLVALERANVVRRVPGYDEHARYELAEDLTGHHHHLVCSRCGTIRDVPASAGLEQSLSAAAAQVVRTTGFRTTHHRIDLVGLCRSCA